MGHREERLRDVRPGLLGLRSGNAVRDRAPTGTDWTVASVPSELVIGPNSIVVTSDGIHSVFVALMWDQGLWRYVEP